jgi:hypothetical protein
VEHPAQLSAPATCAGCWPVNVSSAAPKPAISIGQVASRALRQWTESRQTLWAITHRVSRFRSITSHPKGILPLAIMASIPVVLSQRSGGRFCPRPAGIVMRRSEPSVPTCIALRSQIAAGVVSSEGAENAAALTCQRLPPLVFSAEIKMWNIYPETGESALRRSHASVTTSVVLSPKKRGSLSRDRREKAAQTFTSVVTTLLVLS